MKIYAEYNILGHMQKALEKDFLFIESTKHRADYSALKKIWDSFIKNHLQLITCEDDCLMEFTNYDESIRSYQDVENYLTPYPHMIKKFELFKKIIHRELMICPYGEYGFRRGPSGGGPPEYYELLDQIRIMLNKPKPTNDQKDRDARHIMHCILYGCDFFNNGLQS